MEGKIPVYSADNGVYESLVKVRKYPIPKSLVNPFPTNLTKVGAIPEEKVWIEWCHQMSTMTEQQFEKVKGGALSPPLSYPLCDDNKRYEVIFKHSLFINIFDDLAEIELDESKCCNSLAQMIEHLENNSKSLVFWSPAIIGFYATHKEIYDSSNEAQKRRIIGLLKQYHQGVVAENMVLKQGRPIENLDDYIQIRRNSIYFASYMRTIEYAFNLFVPEHVWDSPKWQRMFNQMTDYTVYMNDIYSFEKELDENKTIDKMLCFNAVAVFCHSEGITIQESMEKLTGIILGIEKEFLALEEDLIREHQGIPDVKKAIDAINQMLSGFVAIYQITDRYNKQD